jgi:hypothetical protein
MASREALAASFFSLDQSFSELVPSHVPCRQAFGLAGRQSWSFAQGVPLPQFVPFRLSQPVEKPPSGPHWRHEIKLGPLSHSGAHRQRPRATPNPDGLGWTDKYPSAIAARG